MAKISEVFHEFKGTPNFNRIPVTYTKDQWYITIGKNSIAKIQDSKSIHTWTLLKGHIHYFTTPVAYFKGRLCSIINNTILLIWSDEDQSLENAKKVKLQEEVHSLIHLQEAEPIVVFQSGKFTIVDDSALHQSELLQSVKFDKNDYLEWVDATVSSTSIEMFYLTSNKKKKQKLLYHFSVNKEDKTVSPPDIFHITSEAANFKVCCLNHQDLSFFSLCSDGKLRCHNLKDSSDKIILCLEDICTDMIMDICFIDSKHVVIVKAKPKEEECVLEIWDIELSVLRGCRKIKIPELRSLQVSSTDDYIFLNFVSDKLIAIPYFLDSSFASTLNTSKPKEFQQLAWNTDLEVTQVPLEDEPMDINCLNSDSLDSIEDFVEKMLKEDIFDLKFISESQLIKLLQLVIRHNKENQNEMNKDAYNLLNIIFSASFNDVLLVKHIKLLNLEEILVTLEILLKYLTHSINMPDDALQKPSDLQIVNWICLMISSHTETLLFTKDKAAKKLLKDLKKILSIKIKEFEDLEGLQSYLSICCGKKDILPQQISAEKYCLETLDI